MRRYDAIGGISPLAARTEAQREALQAALDDRQPGAFDVVLGMKHAAPKIEDAVAELGARGTRRAVGLVLAPHFSALSVGDYLDRAEAAAAGGRRVHGRASDSWHDLPEYVAFEAAAVDDGLAGLPERTKVLFTAHSLPARMLAMHDPTPTSSAQPASARGRGRRPRPVDRLGRRAGSRPAGRRSRGSAPTSSTVIDDLAAEGAPGVLVCACGFVADHLEVLYDLDIEARRRADAAGLAFARTRCVNDDPAVLGALADLVIAAA